MEHIEEVLQMSTEKSKNDRSSRADDDGETLDVSTQRSGSSPQSGPLSPGGRDLVTDLQRLAYLEKEVQKLRKLLGLRGQLSTTQGTMTAEEKPKVAPGNKASRDIGCQTDGAEVSL